MGPAPMGGTGRNQDWEEGESEVGHSPGKGLEWLFRECQFGGDWLDLHTSNSWANQSLMWAALGKGKTWER